LLLLSVVQRDSGIARRMLLLASMSETQLIRRDAINRARIRRWRRRDVSGSDRPELCASRSRTGRLTRAAPGLIDRLTRMTLIQELDFIGIPSQDAARARSFYRDVLGMRPDEHAEYEQWAGSTCFVVWEPERVGMEFTAQTGNPLPLRVEDVGAARAELESQGVTFFGDTLDTGVCHMAIFADPDGNQLMLHRRYAPYGNA
jgi:catechol 2,3-dioxygenase-like lactoylglutathione lyase family enzyme